MAIYTNFDGTFRNSIQIGKQGPKLTKQDQKLVVHQKDGTTTSTIVVATPTADNDASTKKYVDDKFGTIGPKVRTNAESDAIYQKVSEKNQASGYVGLGTNGKIESQYIPSFVISKVIVARNKFDRNKDTTVNIGDTAIITAIPDWTTNTTYSAGDIVKVPDASVTQKYKFYVAKANFTSAATFTVANWNNSNYSTTTTYNTGDEVVHNNIMYVVIIDGVLNKTPADDTNYDLDIADAGSYILRAKSGANNTTVDADWVSTITGAQVTSFKGRTGAVVAETNDYTDQQIQFTAYSDLAAGSVRSAIIGVADRRVKLSGDALTGALSLADSTASSPALVMFGTTTTGIYNSVDNAVGIGFSGSEKMRFGTSIIASTELNMTNHRVINLATPTTDTDAVTKQYVDALPAISQSPSDPSASNGKESDVHLRAATGGTIRSPITSVWNAITSDGNDYIALNNQTSGQLGAISDNSGESWTSMSVGSASTALDTYEYVVTNSTGHYLAVRKRIIHTSTASQLMYTVDGGTNWVSVTQANFPYSGEFVAANSTLGTNYILVDKSGDSAYYSVDNGNSWTKVSLPTTGTWASAAGKANTFVAITGGATTNNKTVRSTDGGRTWIAGGDLPSIMEWQSVATSNGTNFIAVGRASSNAATTTVAYSDDGGATWYASTMPEAGQWNDIESNGAAYIAVRSNSNKAARTIDGGRSWSVVSLPRTTQWGRVASNGQSFVLLDVNQTTNTPFAVSTDGGIEWVDKTSGGISNIFVKKGTQWLPYRGVTKEAGDARYVTKTGDKMTGRLVIDTGRSGYSLQVSGGISAGTSVETLPVLTNSSASVQGGRVECGALNQDAVNNGEVYRWKFLTEGNNTGLSMKLQSVLRGAATVDRLVLNADDTVLSSPVGIYKSASSSSMHVETKSTDGKVGLSVFAPATRAAVELVSGLNSNSTFFLNCINNTSSVSNTAPQLTSNASTFSVATSGAIRTQHTVTAGAGAVNDLARYQAYVQAGQTGLVVNSEIAPSNSANMKGIELVSRVNNSLSDTFSHITVREGAQVVFALNKNELNITKRVGINRAASTKASLAVGGTDSMIIPVGTTAQRPTSPEKGMMRFNSTTNVYEVYTGSEWFEINAGDNTYSKELVTSDWVQVNGIWTATITNAIHKLGSVVTITTQVKRNDRFYTAHMDSSVDSNGSVLIEVTDSTAPTGVRVIIRK